MTLNFHGGLSLIALRDLRIISLKFLLLLLSRVLYYSSWVVNNSASLTLNQSSYTWRVNAMDNALNYTTSTAVYFVTVDTAPPPAVSTLNTPLNNLTTNQMTLNFTWTGVTDSPAGIANYILEVATSSSFVPIAYSSWVVLNQATLTLNQSSYTWRVNTMDNALNYTTSTAVYFVTVDTTPPPAVATLNTPLNNLTTNQMMLNFSWTGVTDAQVGISNYILQVSTDPAFGTINYSSWVVLNSASLTLNQSSYTWRVNTMDNALNYTTSTAVYFVTVDTTPPLIVNDQPGDYQWRSSSGAVYGVFFQDSLSGCVTAQYQLTDANSNVIVGWQNIFAGSTTYAAYYSSWPITNSNFNSLYEGTTNLVYTRVYDAAGNLTTSPSPSFFILKDTHAPVCVVNVSSYSYSYSQWYMNINFFDPPTPGMVPGCSGLNNAQYSLNSATGPWTQIFLNTSPGTTYYTSPWQINFGALPAGTTSYGFIQIQDFAGNTTTYLDAFSVFRPTITTPIIHDNQAGDFNWYNSSQSFVSQPYNVAVQNGQNAVISSITVSAYSGTHGSGIKYLPETIVVTTNVYTYNTAWNLVPSTFTPNYYIWSLLQNGTNYIAVTAYDALGSSTTLYDAFYVRKDTTPPPAPILSAPLNASSTGTVNVGFSWQVSNDGIGSGTTNYTIVVATSSDFGKIVFTSTTPNNYATSTILNQNLYYWQVRAGDYAGNLGIWSSTWSVIVDTTPPPAVSTLSAPLNNLTTNQMTLTFGWSTVTDSPAGLANYILEVSTAPDFSGVITSSWVFNNSATLTLNQSSYTWRVNTMDNALNYTTSTVKYFVTVDTTPPPAISTLNTPLNSLTTNQMTLNFSWAGVTDSPAGLANYILEVSTDPAFSVISYSSATLLTNATLTLNQSSYTWRVNTMDNALNYTTSTLKYFVTVDTTPPPAVSTLTAPGIMFTV